MGGSPAGGARPGAGLERALRAARLDRSLYAEVAGDEHATGAALGVMLAAAGASALGAGGGAAGVLAALAHDALLLGLAVAAVHGGARLLGLGPGLAPLFRGLGFASAPFALGLLAGLPGVGDLLDLVRWGLTLAAWGTAASEALDARGAAPWALCAVGLGVASAGAALL